jgi:hypothetical protein
MSEGEISMDPPEHRNAGALQIVQTRDIVRGEAFRMYRAIRRTGTKSNRALLFRLLLIPAILGMGSAGSAFLIHFFKTANVGIPFPAWGEVGFVVGALSLWAIAFCRTRSATNENAEWFKAGNRYAVGDDGVTTTIRDVISFYPWHSLRDLRATGEYVLIFIANMHAVVLVKAAFESQDIEGFCAELQRRWQASKANFDGAAPAVA